MRIVLFVEIRKIGVKSTITELLIDDKTFVDLHCHATVITYTRAGLLGWKIPNAHVPLVCLLVHGYKGYDSWKMRATSISVPIIPLPLHVHKGTTWCSQKSKKQE